MKKDKGSIQPAGSSGREGDSWSSRRNGNRFQMRDRRSFSFPYSFLSYSRVLLGIAILTVAVYSLFLRSSKISQLSGPASLTPQRGVGECWAQETPAASAAKSKEKVENATWDSLRDVQEFLKKREAKIQETEGILEKKEQRLSSVKQEIIQRLEELKLLNKKIEEKEKQLDEQQEKRIKDLSKIFEGAPPEKAGSIIAQTDISTAAEIIMRMDKRKAGQLWGFIDPKLAAEITKNIIAKGAREEKFSTRQSSGQ